MGKIVRIMMLPLLLGATLTLSLAPGCGDDDGDTSGGMTQAELEQMVADTMVVINDVDSYKMKMDSDMFMSMTGGSESGTMDMEMSVEGEVDQANMEMRMLVNMSMDMDMAGTNESIQDITMEMYMLDDYVYIKMSMPEMGEEWMKMPATDDVMSTYDMNMLDEQLMMLDTPGEITYLRDENFGGSDCYVIELVPDMDKMADWVNQQGLADMEIGLEDLDMLSDMFKGLTYTIWIAKDTKYMRRMTAYMLMEISEDDFKELGGGEGTMTMDMNMDIEMYDYNQPVDMTLPEEALEAMEISL
jgi:hypothetical protein